PCDGAADSVMLQDQLEALARIHQFLKGNLDDAIEFRLGVLSIADVYVFDRRSYLCRFANRPEIRPRADDIAIGQKQFSRLPRRFPQSLLIYRTRDRFGLDQRESQPVADLHQARGE